MTPQLSEMLAENRRTPFLIDLYGVENSGAETRSPYRIARLVEHHGVPTVARSTYWNHNTGRRNVQLRFESEDDRFQAAQILDGKFEKIKISDDGGRPYDNSQICGSGRKNFGHG